MGCSLYLVLAPAGAASTFSLMVYSSGLLRPGEGLRAGSRCTRHFPQTHFVVPSVATGLLLPLAVSGLVQPTVCRGLCPFLFVDGPVLLPPWHPGWCLVSPSRCLSGLLAGYCLRGTRVGCPLLRTPAAFPTPLAWTFALTLRVRGELWDCNEPLLGLRWTLVPNRSPALVALSQQTPRCQSGILLVLSSLGTLFGFLAVRPIVVVRLPIVFFHPALFPLVSGYIPFVLSRDPPFVAGWRMKSVS